MVCCGDGPGIRDEAVLSMANDESALLMTLDKDFGELVYRQHLVHSGVILIRLEGLLSGTKATIVAQSFERYSTEFLHAFTVISPGHIRTRRRRS